MTDARLFFAAATTLGVVLIGGITNALRTQGKLTIRLGQGGTIKNGANAILATALAEAEARRRRVRNNVAANRLGTVLGKTHSI